jgi:hypothetical protein
VEPPHSGGAAEDAPTNGHPGNQVLKTWIWPTIPVHLPPTQAEWIVQRKWYRPVFLKVLFTTFLLLALRTCLAMLQFLPVLIDVVTSVGGVLPLDDDLCPGLCGVRQAGPPSVARFGFDRVGGGCGRGRAAIARDPATSATTRINLDVLDSIRTSPLSSIALSTPQLGARTRALLSLRRNGI